MFYKERVTLIKLVPYTSTYEGETLERMADFFGFHDALVTAQGQESAESPGDGELRGTLSEWREHPGALFIIAKEDVSVGFIRISYRGPSVAWIEDIFVDTEHRGKGVATAAIRAAESIVMNRPGYTAVCLDVAPRNTAALRLYHRLGYTGLSLITVRKEFGESGRDKPVKLLDFDFCY